MKLNELKPALGSTTVGKRKGRGPGTGNGKTAGRGHKGQWLAPVAAFAPASKAVRCPLPAVSPSVASTI